MRSEFFALRRRQIVVRFCLGVGSPVLLTHGPDAGTQAVVLEDFECFGIAFNG
jgi:hypothetical protein